MPTRPNHARRDGLGILPPEIMYEIISYLRPTDFINFVFSDYNLLQRHGIAPPQPRHQIVARLEAESSSSSFSSHARNVSSGLTTPFDRLPNELVLSILSSLQPRAMVDFVLAHYTYLLLRGMVPRASELM